MTTEVKRPGWVTFAAMMMFLVAAFDLVSAISAFMDASWLSSLPVDVGGSLWIWGIIDLVLAAAFIFAGYSILKGGMFGYWWGLLFAFLAAMKWFFYIVWVPWWSLTVIALCVLIIYALSSNSDYFSYN